MGFPTTPDPTLNFHSGRPLVASTALNQPSSVPYKTTFPALTSTPLHTGYGSSIVHTLRPEPASRAMNAPMCPPPGPAWYGVLAPINGVPAIRVAVTAS